MRIRKHAKISPLVYAVSSLKAGAVVLEPHVCQLNQSPWDVVTFSPPPSPPPPPSPQVNGSRGSAGNGSSARSITAAHREEHSAWPISDTMQVEDEHLPPAVESVAICCKTDGKSWQCRREASKGHSLCDHHLSLVKSYTTNSSHQTTKKPSSSRKKAAAAASSSNGNGHEFYYYSGFGPRWGKKRGESSRNKQENETMIGADDQNQFGENEDDEEEEEEVGKKRVRKRIKARSLKSLM